MDDKNINQGKITQNNSSDDSVTITPSFVDDTISPPVEKKRDISAIIPKFEENDNNANLVELVSKDNELKSDGSVSLGSINSEGNVFLNNAAVLPEQIDIEKRKIEAQKRKSHKNKKQKKKLSLSAQKVQNSTALLALVIIVALAGFAYYFFNRPTDEDFMPINLTIELGEKLPIRTSAYVKPGIGKDVDELAYALDLSNVNVSQPGTYEFTVTHSGIKKNGQIIIQDTTAPELNVRQLVISQGSSYNAASFVQTCSDPSGCNYSFQDEATTTKYTLPGSYVVYVVATDAYNNATTKQASLIIEAEGNLRTYIKNIHYDNSLGYEVVETYNLRFLNNQDNSILFGGTHIVEHIYQDQTKYQKDQETYAGEVNYTFDNANMKIIYTESNLNFVGSNYSKLSDIESYLSREGFSYVN